MEYPRGLMLLLALLALGMCWDVSVVLDWEPGVWMAVLLLVGRIAAIVGICMRNELGWWLAISFYLLIVILSGLAATATNSPVVIAGTAIPAGCLIYLLFIRDEFA